ncbi:unnamed protein product [Arabis nemorensis]|uniref:Uncharacterized protein n=1 Tax=Arabis nemorensis TaxID=586526 RepID=A0A565BXJ7_9BRAS|nr:unnamed protein product [Arabis nemorensis]
MELRSDLYVRKIAQRSGGKQEEEINLLHNRRFDLRCAISVLYPTYCAQQSFRWRLKDLRCCEKGMQKRRKMIDVAKEA